jgi:hypothetical protein
MSADIEPPAGWRKVMGPIAGRQGAASWDIRALVTDKEVCSMPLIGDRETPYAIRIGSDIDKENPPDYPAEWQGDKGWVKVGRSPADTPESAIVTKPETTHDDLAERLAIAIAPAIIAEWSYNNEDLPAEIAKLAKAIAGELRK